MADFLDRQNAQRLQSQGLEVNNHNLYAMHHFGAKGLTFAKAAMDAPMAQILTEAQLKANPYLAKMSKAQLIAHWDKRAGVQAAQAAAGHDTPSTRVQIDDAADARAAEIEVLQSMGENLTDAQRARLGQLQAEEAAAQPARSFEQELAEAAELDGQAQQAQQAGQAQSVPGRAAEMVLQNRDRSTAASIEQMNAIAAKPDYLRTGPSRTMDQGAPVVFGDFPASSILGREETVADGRGDRVRTRYAVVDAADVIPSNTADGLPVQSYAAGEPGKLRAVAGNGRAAGLIEAYNRGTAGQYRQELMEDAQSLGIEPAHIERLQSPMLVRIMDEADVTPDIGDRSNTAATARLSPLEEASNDAKRVNLAALEFGEDGSPSAASLCGFINAMPEAERGNMLGPDGAPTRQAVDRLMAAAFKQAYGNDELVKLHAQATDPEARTVMAALADSAGAMAQLAGAGEFDIRQAVADAAALAVNARRKGRTLAQEVQNLDLDMNPEALVIAQFMAQNIRSARRIADGLRNFAQRALQQVQIAEQNAVQGGMFGDQPTLTRKQLFEEFGNAHQQPAAQPGATRAESGQAPAAQPGRAGPDAQLAQPERAHARAAGDRPADRAQGGAAAGQDGRVEAAAGAAAGPGSADRPDVRLSRQKGQAQELGQTQQQYKDTERAYGGRAAYDRAKAAGKTKLSYGQWVQVRTPSFKQWFGDWELAGLAKSMRRVRGSNQAKEVRAEIVGAELVNLESGFTATVSGESFAKMMSRSNVERSVSSQAHMQALGNIDKLFALAYVREVRAPKKVHDAGDMAAVHHFEVPMPFDGQVLRVKIMGKEFVSPDKGNRLYLIEAVEIENAGVEGEDPGVSGQFQRGGETASSPLPGADARFAQMVEAVNGDGVSKAVDPDTGEPLAAHLDGGHEFEQTARAYGGKAAWEKAKAEGKTKLTYHQWVQVRTPAFKKWWGYDWEQTGQRQGAAKGLQRDDVGGVDRVAAAADARNGGATGQVWGLDRDTAEPRLWFHGTKDDIAAFDLEHPNRKDKGWLGNGVYVTDSVDLAEIYANNKRGQGGANVMPLFAAVRNPYVADVGLKKRLRHANAAQVSAFTKALQGRGFDGVVVRLAEDAAEMVAFEPTAIKSAIGNSGDFDAQNPDIRYSRQQQAAGQQRAEQVRRTVDGIRRHWKNAPEVVVAASLHDEAIPEELRSAVQAKPGQGAPEGFFHDGKVYLIADRLPKPRDVARVLLHEALGHWGLRGVFGKRLTLVLRDIQAARPQEVIAKAREYGLHGLGQAKEASNSEIWKSMSQEQRDEAAEEVLASMAQHQPQLGFVRRAVAAMRSWLREHVPLFNELALTQDEIVNNYLLPARRWVERSAKAGVAGGRPALSRSRPRQASDAEKARILQGEPVARLATEDAPSGSYADVVQAVARMFARQGGVATRQDIGEVVLDERAAKSSMAHGGANAYKRAAFAAVKDVIERGAVVMQAQHARDGTSFYIAAPVTIDGSDNMVTVLVRKDANTQRMYLHSVMLKENLLKPSVSAAGAKAPKPHSATTSGDAQSIAQNTHEREAVESPLKRRVSSVDAKASERSGSSASGDSWSIAQNAHKREATKSLLDLRVSRTDTASGVERSGSTNQEGKATVPPSPQEGKAAPEAVADELRRLLTLDVQAGPQDVRFSRSQRVRAAANAALDKVGDWMDDSLDIPEHWSPAEKSAASKFDRYSKKQPLSERVREIGHNARDRVVQGVVDQFRPLKGLSKTAWMQAQLSKGTDGAVEAVATLGIPVLKDGAIAVETDKYPEGFLGELSKQLGSTEEVRNFFMYVVGNRADQLSKEWTVTYADGTTVRYKDQATALQAAKGKPGAKAQAASRENLFNAEEIEAMKNKLYGKMANGRPRPDAYHNALVALNRYNRSILDIAEAAGLIDPESRKQWESDFYVPFYRVSAENNTAFDFSSKGTGLARQQVIRRLEGGTDNLGDPLENLMANWHAMLTASMRNLAANNALNAAQSMGEARQVKEPVEGGTWTMQGGKKVYWQVDDPLVLIALESLNFNGYNNALMRTAGKAKHMLTVGVTASPVFRIRNLIRDTLQATATADVGYNPIGNALEGLALTAKGSDTRAQLIAGGGAVRFGSFNDGNQAQHYERMIAKGIEEGQILDTPQKIRRFFGDALNNYQEVGDRIEMVNRAVIYQRALAEGKSHLEASFEARDLMNFTSMGSFAAVRAIAQVVPFANARVQGMDRLVRGAARDPRRFWAVTGLIGMASAVLYLLNADDDEYRAMPDYIRNTYWPVKMGGKWYYIPKPFEVGAMGTVVERFTELVFSDGDYQAKDFKDSVMSILMNSLSMNLTPQLIKPAAEAWFNYDMFHEQAIEGMALERLLPEDRYDANTSAAAIAAGRALGASPKKIEHLIRGYFGWLGVQALNAGDWMARPMMDLPESPKSDLSSVNNWFVVGDMVKDSGTIPSKYAERFYRLQSEINEIYASASNARRLGELQRYQELVSRPEMAAYPVLHQAQKGVTLINQQMRLTLASSAPAAEKNRRLQELRARRDEIARRVDKIVREAEMGRKGG